MVKGCVFLSSVGIRIYGAHVAQLVEHVLGKDEVISSSLIVGSMSKSNES